MLISTGTFCAAACGCPSRYHVLAKLQMYGLALSLFTCMLVGQSVLSIRLACLQFACLHPEGKKSQTLNVLRIAKVD